MGLFAQTEDKHKAWPTCICNTPNRSRYTISQSWLCNATTRTFVRTPANDHGLSGPSPASPLLFVPLGIPQYPNIVPVGGAKQSVHHGPYCPRNLEPVQRLVFDPRCLHVVADASNRLQGAIPSNRVRISTHINPPAQVSNCSHSLTHQPSDTLVHVIQSFPITNFRSRPVRPILFTYQPLAHLHTCLDTYLKYIRNTSQPQPT